MMNINVKIIGVIILLLNFTSLENIDLPIMIKMEGAIPIADKAKFQASPSKSTLSPVNAK